MAAALQQLSVSSILAEDCAHTPSGSAQFDSPLHAACDGDALSHGPVAGPRQVTVWGTSLIIHAVVLLASSAVYFTVDSQAEFPVFTSVIEDVDDEPLVQDITQQLDVRPVDADTPVAETVQSVATKATQQNIQERQLDPLVEDEMPPEPLAFAMDDSELVETLEGVQGDVVLTDGDVGSVDHITLEIVSRLREKKVVVAWLMDASESLKVRREEVIARFERVYAELDELAEGHEELLLTSVAAFGEQTVAMTKEPTADRKAIQQAVRQIPVDETGIENVFGAIRTTALDHRTLARKGYEVMIVVLTDECGNDFDVLEDAVQQVTHLKMPVFVMGPMAPFGEHEVRVPWIDPATKEVHHLPVERGPESIRFETPRVPTWNETVRNMVLASGFGSYGLAQITRESGGIYFLHRDNNVSTDGIDFVAMASHSPDYISATEYAKLLRRSPVRQSVLATTEASRKADWKQPQTKFLESGIQFDIRDDQSTLMKIANFLDQAIAELQAVEEDRESEMSSRWRAHYDLLMGRLLANRVRLNQSLPLLNEMYAKPKVCRDGTTNAWELAGQKGSSPRDLVALNAEGAVKAKAPNSILETDDSSDALRAQEYLQRVESQHPGTPWAVLASLELDTPLNFEWREAFIMPPKGEKLPWDKKPWDELSDKQKEAKKKFERFQALKKQKQAEQDVKTDEEKGKKPTKIPKL